MTTTKLSLEDRCASYATLCPDWPAPRVTGDGRWLEGTWILGNDYRSRSGTGFYGSYPPNFLRRVYALFPEMRSVIHLFSGSLTLDEAMRHAPSTKVSMHLIDSRGPDDGCHPTWRCDAHELAAETHGVFDLVIADPPYSPDDAKRYGTPMVRRNVVLQQLYQIVPAGGHLVWLDTILPIFRKREWHWCGAITVIRSTNHRVRLASIFERQP